MTPERIEAIEPPVPDGLSGPEATAWARAYVGEFVRSQDAKKAAEAADQSLTIGRRLVKAEHKLTV